MEQKDEKQMKPPIIRVPVKTLSVSLSDPHFFSICKGLPLLKVSFQHPPPSLELSTNLSFL